VVAAIIPALLYFLVLGLYAQFRAVQLNIRHEVTPVDFREMLLRAPLFIVPLGMIVYFLVMGHSLAYCAFMGVTSAIVLGFFRKKTRPSLSGWIKGFTQGAIAGSSIAVAIATVGMVVRTLIATGLGVRMPGIVEALSGGILIIALVIVGIISIILGMGMGTLPVYLLVAMVAAPILIKMGLGVLQAHFFCFFFAMFSMITPPIAAGVIVASKLAGSRFIPTTLEALKAAMGLFVLPFLIIWNPVLLLLPETSAILAVTKLIACLLLLVTLEVSIVNCYIRPLKPWERGLFVICAVAIIGYLVTHNALLIIVGLALFIFLTVAQLVERRRLLEPA